jgi:hypothetical protein
MTDIVKIPVQQRNSSILLAAWIGLAAASAAQAAPDRVTVAWDANPEPDIASYNVYYGIVGSGVTNSISPGSTTQQQVINLLPQTEYWFYVTAVNTAGLESDPSQVLTYTTPVNQAPTVTLGADRIAITPGTVSITAQAADDHLSPDALTTSWTQLSGPAVNLTGANQLTASLPLTSAGTYSFRVTVNDGNQGASDEVAVYAYQPVSNPPPGTVVPNIAGVFQTFDGLVIQWDSQNGVNYRIGYKYDLGQSTWSIIANNVASQGPTTYWVDESGQLGEQGFYAIFQVP